MTRFGIVSVHQGFRGRVHSATSASGIWSMTDRLYFPPDGAFSQLTGYGHYNETYEKVGGHWVIKTTHIRRIRVEVA